MTQTNLSKRSHRGNNRKNKMKLLVNGTDILDDVYLLECVYEDYATNKSSRLYLKFDDSDCLWQKWQMSKNDEIIIKDGQCDTGVMYAHRVQFSRGLCEIFAKSIPYYAPMKQQATFEDVKLSKFAQKAAAEMDFTIDMSNAADRLYKTVNLDNISFFQQFKQLCFLEGIGIIFYNKKIILFNENTLENNAASGDFEVEIDDEFSISDNTDKIYGICKLQNGYLEGKFTANNGSTETLIYDGSTPATSVGEANRFAKGILRNANKTALCGTVSTDLKTDYAAGSVLNLINAKAENYNGKIYIYKIRHDFVDDKSKLFFRYPIEDY